MGAISGVRLPSHVGKGKWGNVRGMSRMSEVGDYAPVPNE